MKTNLPVAPKEEQMRYEYWQNKHIWNTDTKNKEELPHKSCLGTVIKNNRVFVGVEEGGWEREMEGLGGGGGYQIFYRLSYAYCNIMIIKSSSWCLENT